MVNLALVRTLQRSPVQMKVRTAVLQNQYLTPRLAGYFAGVIDPLSILVFIFSDPAHRIIFFDTLLITWIKRCHWPIVELNMLIRNDLLGSHRDSKNSFKLSSHDWSPSPAWFNICRFLLSPRSTNRCSAFQAAPINQIVDDKYGKGES